MKVSKPEMKCNHTSRMEQSATGIWQCFDCYRWGFIPDYGTSFDAPDDAT